MVKKMIADQDGMLTDLDTNDNEPIMFEYDYDEQNRKIVLGKGKLSVSYSWVQKVVYGYEANLLISPLFEGQYI